MTQPSGEANLPERLGELEARLRRWGAPVVAAFRVGVPPDRVRTLLANAELGMPDDIVAWWSWHDGVEGPVVRTGPGIVQRPENAIGAGWYVMSLDDALRIRRWIRADYAQLGLPDAVPGSWIPLLHYTGTAFLAGDTRATGPDSPLYIVDGSAGLPEASPRPQFASLGEFVDILIRLFDGGVFRPDPEDPRVASLNDSPTTDDVRKLTRW